MGTGTANPLPSPSPQGESGRLVRLDVPILPARTFVAVWAALIALTGITVAVAKGDLLARYSVLGALGIASLKASLVVGWFMHLRYESRLLRALVLLALTAVLVILALTFTDVWYRR